MTLVGLILHAYDTSVKVVPRHSPLYMEMILFHVVKNLCSLGEYTLCGQLAGILCYRISKVQEVCIVESGSHL